MKKTITRTLTYYKGPSPKCKYCGSSDTSYKREIEVPYGVMIDTYPPHIILVTCHKCHKEFTVNLIEEGYVKKDGVTPTKECPDTSDTFTDEEMFELKEYIAEKKKKEVKDLTGLYKKEVNKAELEEYVQAHRGRLFNRVLFKMIDDRGLKDVDVYKKAGVDRRIFSKIKSKDGFIPSKDTIVRLCFGLGLDSNQANTFLNIAGYALTPSEVKDIVIMFCLDRKYDYSKVDQAYEKLEREGK